MPTSILTPETRQPSRARSSFAWSVLLHCVGTAALLFIGTKAVAPSVRKAAVTLTAPVVARKIEPLGKIKFKIKLFHAPPPKQVAQAASPVLTPVPSITHIESSPAPLLTPAPTVPLPTASVAPPQRPVVQTGSFETVSKPVESRAVARVQSTAFDSSQAPVKQPKLSVSESSGFTAAITSASPSGAKASGAASSAVFGEANVGASSASRRTALIADSSFGSIAAAAPKLSQREPISADASFRAVEIIYKPRPLYTPEARQRKLEGDVQLEVIFGLDSHIQVLRVLQGLGHGLDESAIAAATAIRFRPALRQGAPVNTTASIRIRFELAY